MESHSSAKELGYKYLREVNYFNVVELSGYLLALRTIGVFLCVYIFACLKLSPLIVNLTL